MRIADLPGKRIAIAGLGTNNQKLADYLTANQVAFDIVEWESQEELISKLKLNYDLIFRTPGLPYLSPAIQQAQKNGATISSQTALFFQLCPAPIIGVTGTKGKGTTSSLIAKILSQTGEKVWLGGNIGRDPFEFLDQIKPTDRVILELSSFQLQDMTQSPHLAVVLNITPDHLNHHQSMNEYINAKANILIHQKPTDIAVLHSGLPENFKNLGQGQKIILDPNQASGFKTQLLGTHNLDNIAAAVEVARILEVPESDIIQAIETFEPLPHRLQTLGNFAGVTYIDDGYSTNVDPVLAATQAVSGPLILIIGGFDKGLDFTQVGRRIVEHKSIKAVVVIGQMTEKILATLKDFKGKVLTGAKNMTEILSQARSVATSGDTIVFSPGTSSFDMFKNETDRSEQFVVQVMKIK